MATIKITAILSPEAVFETLRNQVDPASHGILRKEINRRWPDGHKLQVHLTLPAATADESAH